MDRSNSHDVVSRSGRWARHAALGAIVLMLAHGAAAQGDNPLDREYKVKVAFVYNFLRFVEGGRFAVPEKEQGQTDPNEPFIIGILGIPPSRAAFEEFKGKQVAGRPVILRWFRGFEQLVAKDKDKDQQVPESHPDLDAIRKCHVLFLCPSEKAYLPRILPPLQDNGVLTVGDVPAFLEGGGVINLLIEENKVRFEVNLAAAGRAKLTIRSSLLRLAVRTVEHDQLEPPQDKEKPGESGRS